MPFLLAALLALAGPCLVQAQPQLPRVAIIVDDADAQTLPVFKKISKAIQSYTLLSVYKLDQLEITDPIEKGKLLAALQARNLIVVVGDGPTEFVTQEIDDTPIYFVDAGLISGANISADNVSGIFSYNVEKLLDAVDQLRLGTIGFVYTPGYEPVVNWVRAGAAARGLVLSEKKITNIRDFAPAIRDLLEHSSAIWVVGDPLLVRGAGFEFLRERSLARRVPLIANGLWEVKEGALIAFKPRADTLASTAAAAINSILNEKSGATTRFQPAPRNGVLIINGTLVRKWKINLRKNHELIWKIEH